MKFNAREDIEAPIDVVFARLTDFDQFERQALRRGASVRRVTNGPIQTGSGWDIAFTFRGKERRMRAELADIEQPNSMRIAFQSSGIVGDTLVDLVPLSPRRTRLSVSINLSAKTLSSRLLLQSFKLARGTIAQRFKKRVASFADDVADKYKSGL